MNLHSSIPGLHLPQKSILRVSETCDRPVDVRLQEVLLVDEGDAHHGHGFGLVLNKSDRVGMRRTMHLPPDFGYVASGDILRFSPHGDVSVLYRKNSPHNSMLVTEQCNSKCVMCSQPPRAIDDGYLVDEWLTAIPLMSSETKELGITGGEPTLHFGRLLHLISATKQHLPCTSLHMLSNGRLFGYLKFAERIAALRHPDFMIGIPLYSDVEDIHDFVVQAKGAFSQTILGLLNLGRVQQKIEIRFVIHQHTYKRLPHFARFVSRNLPFVNHVALMGLELMGYARSNADALWIDPFDYQVELEEAVHILTSARLNVSIYNTPLCLLPKPVWPLARKSISDWKNIYFPECSTCNAQPLCAGFFASSEIRRSKHIRAVSEAEMLSSEAS